MNHYVAPFANKNRLSFENQFTKYNVNFKDDVSTADINFRINPKSKSYVRRINIVGNTKTNDEVYRRELRQFESSMYTESKIDRSKIRLQRLKFVNIRSFQLLYSIK